MNRSFFMSPSSKVLINLIMTLALFQYWPEKSYAETLYIHVPNYYPHYPIGSECSSFNRCKMIPYSTSRQAFYAFNNARDSSENEALLLKDKHIKNLNSAEMEYYEYTPYKLYDLDIYKKINKSYEDDFLKKIKRGKEIKRTFIPESNIKIESYVSRKNICDNDFLVIANEEISQSKESELSNDYCEFNLYTSISAYDKDNPENVFMVTQSKPDSLLEKFIGELAEKNEDFNRNPIAGINEIPGNPKCKKCCTEEIKKCCGICMVKNVFKRGWQ